MTEKETETEKKFILIDNIKQAQEDGDKELEEELLEKYKRKEF